MLKRNQQESGLREKHKSGAKNCESNIHQFFAPNSLIYQLK